MKQCEEIIKRIAQLLVRGYSRGEVFLKLLSGEIYSGNITEELANKWIDKAEKSLEVDIGKDNELNYIRLLNIYQGCIDKRDYANALKAWKELKDYKNSNGDKEITIKFVK